MRNLLCMLLPQSDWDDLCTDTKAMAERGNVPALVFVAETTQFTRMLSQR
jgi:hypothetical protein